MSNPIPLSEVPEDLGRNDPCPCNSGRKYKKCCPRAHRLQKETEKKSREPHRLIGEKTIPWKVFKLLRQVHENNALGLFHDMMHDQGPARERYPERSEFVQAIDTGDQVLPAGPAFELVHIRLDFPDTVLLVQEDDPKKKEIDFQIITLRPNELDEAGEPREIDHRGFRIWNYQRQSLDRADYDSESPLEAFGIDWHPAGD